MRKLSTSYNPEANVIAQQGQVTRNSVSTNNESGRDLMVTELANLLIDIAKVAGKVKDVVLQYIEPKMFKEAWNHPDSMQRAKWREAV
jgi:hypothetical protein